MRAYATRILILSLLSFSVLQGTGPARAASVAAGLPSHFGLGVTAAEDATGLYGWMPNSGVPWDYAYQYIAGGVNTADNWQSWEPNATFPLHYANGAASHGYIPVFPYYELYQSTGPCDTCVEPQKDLANLNSATLMATYFADFTMVMKRLGARSWDGVTGFGKTAIVHVEPDLSGYAQQAVLDPAHNCYGFCTGTGNDPSLLKAAVASSGNSDVAGYTDTYRGFNLALLHLRDVYAPNVLLAIHVSGWTTIDDIDSDRRTNLDPVAMGAKAGAFANLSGAAPSAPGTSTYDLVFNDMADRDAGYYKYVRGQNVFWDRLNVTFPNFHRWESYIGSITQATGKPAVAWQIPVGNQVYRTENNTDGHYQDNRVEYFLAHIDELKAAGVIALLFGRGNPGSTELFDNRNDGVTNPAPVCTADGLSSGQICSNATSTSSDDDGGYLRETAATYYRSLVTTKTPRPAVARSSTFYLRNTLTSGAADTAFPYGTTTDIPLMGDWTGTGTRTPAVFRNGTWYLRNTNTAGNGDTAFAFGQAGDIPVVGDWTGSGHDLPGVFRNGTWYLRNTLTNGIADTTFTYGSPGDTPVSGDWTGSGHDLPGVFRNGTWYLRNTPTNGVADTTFTYGQAGDIPVVGDWTGVGHDVPGVFRAGAWYLRNSLTTGIADMRFTYGTNGDIPLTWLG